MLDGFLDIGETSVAQMNLCPNESYRRGQLIKKKKSSSDADYRGNHSRVRRMLKVGAMACYFILGSQGRPFQ